MTPGQIPAGMAEEILAVSKRYGRANWDILNAMEKALAKTEKI